MADQKISELNELVTWDTDDEFAIVDTDVVETKRMTAENVRANVWLGLIGPEKSLETIDAAGAITVTTSYVEVDTFGAAAADNLDDINGVVIEGTLLILRTDTGARVVTVRDGVGNINCAGNFVMDSNRDRMMLQYTGTEWVEVSRSDNA